MREWRMANGEWRVGKRAGVASGATRSIRYSPFASEVGERGALRRSAQKQSGVAEARPARIVLRRRTPEAFKETLVTMR